jgi:hypothetical protein
MPFVETLCAGFNQSNTSMITETFPCPSLFSKKCQLSTKHPIRNSHRRSRTNYTSDQLNAMEIMFSTNRYPDFNSRTALADAIDLNEARIHVSIYNSL